MTNEPFLTRETPPASIPPLHSGDRLSRTEFERRYAMHPEIKRAELVEGVVYVTSRVRFAAHGQPHSDIVTWLGVYRAATPGVIGADNTTVRLDFENELQPDALLRLEPAQGGHSRVTDDDYIDGPPELLVEVAASSAAYDLHDKRRAYARNGVQEYVAVQIYEQQVNWFVLREGVYVPLAPNADGLLCSTVFPGLWFDPAAFWRGDLAALLATVQRGTATPEHAAFVTRLRATSQDTEEA